jgi:hypothetical protein
MNDTADYHLVRTFKEKVGMKDVALVWKRSSMPEY